MFSGEYPGYEQELSCEGACNYRVHPSAIQIQITSVDAGAWASSRILHE